MGRGFTDAQGIIALRATALPLRLKLLGTAFDTLREQGEFVNEIESLQPGAKASSSFEKPSRIELCDTGFEMLAPAHIDPLTAEKFGTALLSEVCTLLNDIHDTTELSPGALLVSHAAAGRTYRRTTFSPGGSTFQSTCDSLFSNNAPFTLSFYSSNPPPPADVIDTLPGVERPSDIIGLKMSTKTNIASSTSEDWRKIASVRECSACGDSESTYYPFQPAVTQEKTSLCSGCAEEYYDSLFSELPRFERLTRGAGHYSTERATD